MRSGMARAVRVGIATACLVAYGSATPARARGPLDVRLNEIQVLGTHNSYHVQPVPALQALINVFEPVLGPTLEYTHLPLADQFTSQGIRQIELDVFADPTGGLYAEPAGLTIFDPTAHLTELDPPGLKVLHVQDVDFETTCPTFVACLQQIASWSADHPAHLPIFVLVEAKDDILPDPGGFGFVIPAEFGPAELDAIDAEIRSVFSDDQLITPDDVRGSRATLEEAVLSDGWPLLREARGKVIFALDNGGGLRDAYVEGHPSLTGRVLFTSSPPGTPEAAFVKLNDPLGDPLLIPELVANGYLIRTRADADLVEARANDPSRRDVALASGAQFVSTDFPVPDPAIGTPYFVEIPGGGPARCNPVNAPAECESPVLENLTGAQALTGQRLVVIDRAGDPTRRRVLLSSRDPLFDVPLPGSVHDPRVAGATVELSNPGTGESASFFLPPGDEWRLLGESGYVYRDARGANGPCALVHARWGRSLRIRCLGRNGTIPFTLDEPSQGELAVTLRFGDGVLYCTRFGGEISADRPTSGRSGLFSARSAPRASCP